MKQITFWWQAIRFHFTFPTFIPVILGTSYALLVECNFKKLSFFLTLLATILHHVGLNLIDDYYDYQHGVDLMNHNGKNLYSGGSGILTSGNIRPEKIKLAAIICYSITALIGLFLTFVHGYWVLCLGIFGICSSYYYTAPPLKLAYRGLGELLIWLNFGPVILLGSYFIQTEFKYSQILGPVLLSIISGTLTFCLIIANEIPDYQSDLNAGKKNLVVYFGKNFGLLSLIIGIGTILTICILTVVNKIWPIAILVTLLSFPLAVIGIKKLSQTINTTNIHGNEFIVMFCNVFGILLIFSFNFMLLYNNQTIPATIMLIITFLFYLPILIFPPKLNK